MDTIVEKEGIFYNKYCYKIIVPGHLGHRNGYVSVTESSPLFGVEYEILNDMMTSKGIYVHGGLTYSGLLDEQSYIIGSLDNRWWFGFDCAHYGDGKISLSEMSSLIDTLSISEEQKTKYKNDYQNILHYSYDVYSPKSKDYVYEQCVILGDFINRCD